MPEWTEQFEITVRSHLPYLSPDEPLTEDTNMVALGLDSLATISLLVDLEQALGIEIPDADLTPDMFSSPGSLWQITNRLQNQPDSTTDVHQVHTHDLFS